MAVFGTRDFHCKVVKVHKWGDTELEHQCVTVMFVNGCWIVVICLLEVNNIGWDVGEWKVIEPFIKTGMCGNFDTRCFRVTPKDVACGAWHTSEECTASRIWFEFCGVFA